MTSDEYNKKALRMHQNTRYMQARLVSGNRCIPNATCTHTGKTGFDMLIMFWQGVFSPGFAGAIHSAVPLFTSTTAAPDGCGFFVSLPHAIYPKSSPVSDCGAGGLFH